MSWWPFKRRRGPSSVEMLGSLIQQARTPGFWGPKMTRAMAWAGRNGITTHQSPLAFAQAMDAKLGTKGTSSLPVEDAAQVWLDAIDSRSSM